jgi:hypothetical protein
MRKWAAALAMGLATTCVASAQDADVDAYVQAFCGLREADGGAGRIYLLSPGLTEVVTAALEKNAAIQAGNSDEKPPLGDGIPYQGFQDYAPVCEPGAFVAEGDKVIAEVKYVFPDEQDAEAMDRLVLVKGDGGVYVIDDIRYGAEGDDDTLRGALADAFAD